ncbi:MAG TPA: phosphotransferase [Pirellulaceae bacterium]|nr:phosphotransferase [Pirellulaceae bacterium]
MMQTLSIDSAGEYLTTRGFVPRDERLTIRELPGGVSNVVLLVERESGQRLVLKQALPRLRVAQQWLCSIERIWREVDVLRLCGRLLESGVRGQESGVKGQGGIVVRVPEVLIEDRENYCFGMTAAPAEHRTWKELLLAGQAEGAIAAACGRLLGQLHVRSWNDPEIARQLDDRTFFRDLRISPYYDRIREVHRDLAEPIQRLSDSIWQHRRCLVHGDFSPKNLLVAGGELWLIDFEVGHFGDPAFDLGFFLTHLVLKAYVAGGRADEYLALIDAFRGTYQAEIFPVAGADEFAQLWVRTCGALAGCLLARVDGKSPVDYLTPNLQVAVRKTARDLLQRPPTSFDELLARVTAATQTA